MTGETMPVNDPVPKLSLKLRAFKAAGWTMGGHVGNQVLRFAGNLVLTRLLFPEVFGLMAIIQTVMMGVALLSDIGVTQSIIRSDRAHEPQFVNTAWTVQIVKGVLVSLVLALIAVPVAAAYGEPLLAQMLPVAGLAALIHGFVSTKGALRSRAIDVKRLTLISTGCYAVGLGASVLLAWVYPSPWALVWGNLVGALAQVLASHLLLPGPLNRFAWERRSLRELVSFGSAVLLSSGLTFFSGEGNRLVAGLLVDMRILGLMGLAGALNLVLWNAIQQVSARVLYPAYSEVMRSNPGYLSNVVQRSRLVQVWPVWGACLVFAVFGREIIALLYDPRYADAGLILQVQSMGLMVAILSGSYSSVLWSMGRIGLSTVMLAVQGLLQIAGMLVGSYVAGPIGLVVGGAVSGWLMYPVTATVYGRLGLFHPRVDLPVIAASVCAVAAVGLNYDWTAARGW